ncbi:MAG TPA: response regulator transcription factor [Ramlibacter sp.]|uniref:response regulator transcription factor n=1 Tax=Ramlibacter sp. TaxID=1917967 RepID=UPI002BA8297C|nr:response regulator transcription factor [Ramlibacter sp.]HVZ44234.1 response regulator transcription factor [Ramlibacter sp.]
MNPAEGRRIALVQEDADQLDFLRHIVRFIGVSHVAFRSGEAFLEALGHDAFDLLVLDWNLPDLQAPSVVEEVRRRLGPAFPIVFVACRALESDIVAGLRAGADDYVTKPVRAPELSVRIQALLRRAHPLPQCDRMTFGPFMFDVARRRAEVHGKPVELKPPEFDLALSLFTHSGGLLSRTRLMECVVDAAEDAPPRTLEAHVSRVRSKLGILPQNAFRVSSVYGVGYRLDEVSALGAARPAM